jgi:hypothetical protein
MKIAAPPFPKGERTLGTIKPMMALVTQILGG